MVRPDPLRGATRATAALDPVVLRILHHSLYEFRRGVRQLFMMTMSPAEAAPVAARLQVEGVAAYAQTVNAGKVNFFFGHPAFVETARTLADRPLNSLSPEEDFMLGTLLGYDREQQCQRYLARVAGRAVNRPPPC